MNILSIVLGILAIGGIALIHEVGHYFFAKKAGIPVLELSIGIGPKIAAFHKNGTDYSIRPIPFMAYVKLAEKGPGSMEDANLGSRFFLYLGGAFFNIVTAILLFTLVGVFSGFVGNKVLVGQVLDASPAYGVLEKNDVILQLNGTSLDHPSQMQQLLQENREKPAEFTLIRAGKEMKVSLTPVLDAEGNHYIIGIYFGRETLALPQSFIQALNLCKEYVVGTVGLLGNLITGSIPPSESLVGVVGIVALTSDFTTQFWDYLLFVAIISLGMGILNLLPIPALDGGKIVLLGLEKIRGRKLKDKTEETITLIGFGLLLLLMLYTTINDISKIIGG